jgi:hypothetical protein
VTGRSGTAERHPTVERHEVILPDGRRLLYYPFPGSADGGETPRPHDPAAPPPSRPAPEER